MPRRRIPGVLRASDAMLMINVDRPGMKILMPNKFFDYLAAGRPMIVNLEAEVTDWVRKAECGLVADADRPEDLARVVRELRADPKRAEEMGRRAYQLARDQFDRDELHRGWESILVRAAECVASGRGWMRQEAPGMRSAAEIPFRREGTGRCGGFGNPPRDPKEAPGITGG
jgi:hypothetical protein